MAHSRGLCLELLHGASFLGGLDSSESNKFQLFLLSNANVQPVPGVVAIGEFVWKFPTGLASEGQPERNMYPTALESHAEADSRHASEVAASPNQTLLV